MEDFPLRTGNPVATRVRIDGHKADRRFTTEGTVLAVITKRMPCAPIRIGAWRHRRIFWPLRFRSERHGIDFLAGYISQEGVHILASEVVAEGRSQFFAICSTTSTSLLPTREAAA